jgi:hypothetical protein
MEKNRLDNNSKVVAPSDASRPGSRFTFPSDYYSSPPPADRPTVPRQARIGCGIASIIGLLVLLAVGRFFMAGGLPHLIGLALDEVSGEVATHFGPEVPQSERQQLNDALRRLTASTRADEVPLQAIQPVLSELQSALRHPKLSREEVARLTRFVENANRSTKRSGHPRR